MYNRRMSEEPTTKTIKIGWKDAVFAFLLPGSLGGLFFGWCWFADYYDEPGRAIWPWLWSSFLIFLQVGLGIGLICLFVTLLIKDIIIRWNDKP